MGLFEARRGRYDTGRLGCGMRRALVWLHAAMLLACSGPSTEGGAEKGATDNEAGGASGGGASSSDDTSSAGDGTSGAGDNTTVDGDGTTGDGTAGDGTAGDGSGTSIPPECAPLARYEAVLNGTPHPVDLAAAAALDAGLTPEESGFLRTYVWTLEPQSVILGHQEVQTALSIVRPIWEASECYTANQLRFACGPASEWEQFTAAASVFLGQSWVNCISGFGLNLEIQCVASVWQSLESIELCRPEACDDTDPEACGGPFSGQTCGPDPETLFDVCRLACEETGCDLSEYCSQESGECETDPSFPECDTPDGCMSDLDCAVDLYCLGPVSGGSQGNSCCPATGVDGCPPGSMNNLNACWVPCGNFIQGPGSGYNCI